MASKKRVVSRRPKKAGKRTKPAKAAKAVRAKKKIETKKTLALPPQVVQKPIQVEPARERYVITAENIRGDTAIGDLLVTFPRTREVLVRKGLRLEAEDAGDIYMTLDAFSAMNGLEIARLVLEIVEVAREAPPQPVAQIAAPPII